VKNPIMTIPIKKRIRIKLFKMGPVETLYALGTDRGMMGPLRKGKETEIGSNKSE